MFSNGFVSVVHVENNCDALNLRDRLTAIARVAVEKVLKEESRDFPDPDGSNTRYSLSLTVEMKAL